MSKRVQRYECDECGDSYAEKEGAERCERNHADDRNREACDKVAGEIAEETWALSLGQLHELLALVKKMGQENQAKGSP